MPYAMPAASPASSPQAHKEDMLSGRYDSSADSKAPIMALPGSLLSAPAVAPRSPRPAMPSALGRYDASLLRRREGYVSRGAALRNTAHDTDNLAAGL